MRPNLTGTHAFHHPKKAAGRNLRHPSQNKPDSHHCPSGRRGGAGNAGSNEKAIVPKKAVFIYEQENVIPKMPNAKGNSALIIAAIIIIVLLVSSNYNTVAASQDMSVWGWLTSLFSPKKTSISISETVPPPPVSQVPKVETPSNCPTDLAESKNKVYKLGNDLFDCKMKLGTLQSNYDDLSESLDALREWRTEASDSLMRSETKICGVNYWNRVDCSRELGDIHCTGSMNDVFSCYNAVIIYKTNNLRIGDIIAVWIPEKNRKDYGGLSFLIHRITGFNGTRIITKGDTAPSWDAFQTIPVDVIGKVKGVRY